MEDLNNYTSELTLLESDRPASLYLPHTSDDSLKNFGLAFNGDARNTEPNPIDKLHDQSPDELLDSFSTDSSNSRAIEAKRSYSLLEEEFRNILLPNFDESVQDQSEKLHNRHRNLLTAQSNNLLELDNWVEGAAPRLWRTAVLQRPLDVETHLVIEQSASLEGLPVQQCFETMSVSTYKSAKTSMTKSSHDTGSTGDHTGSNPPEIRRKSISILNSNVPAKSTGLALLAPRSSSDRSDWKLLLYRKNLIPTKLEEMDWSGRGQHAEFKISENDKVPLKHEKFLGSGGYGYVDSVRCRRIRLARKTILCSRNLRREDAIKEVENLQKLCHRHIVRLVGTYVIGTRLCILMYPVADHNLEEFLPLTFQDQPDSLSSKISHYTVPVDLDISTSSAQESSLPSNRGLVSLVGHQRACLLQFFGCLASALSFIHGCNIKHADIKPKNLLVRKDSTTSSYKIYVADFGIARSYNSELEAETAGPSFYTKRYSAPELVHSATRGYNVDIFSLGCVYLEMLAASISDKTHNEIEKLNQICGKNAEGDKSYQANIDDLLLWFLGVINAHPTIPYHPNHNGIKTLYNIIPKMIAVDRFQRPSAKELAQVLMSAPYFCCGFCSSGGEPFEAAEADEKVMVK